MAEVFAVLLAFGGGKLLGLWPRLGSTGVVGLIGEGRTRSRESQQQISNMAEDEEGIAKRWN